MLVHLTPPRFFLIPVCRGEYNNGNDLFEGGHRTDASYKLGINLNGRQDLGGYRSSIRFRDCDLGNECEECVKQGSGSLQLLVYTLTTQRRRVQQYPYRFCDHHQTLAEPPTATALVSAVPPVAMNRTLDGSVCHPVS